MAKRAVSLAVPILLVVAACAGDDDASGDESSVATEEASSADDSAEVTTPADSGEEETDDGSSGPDASTAPSEGTTVDVDDGDMVFTGDPNSEWCVAGRDIEERFEVLDAGELDIADPVAVEENFTALLAEFEAVVDLAPEEIADDVRVQLEGFRLLNDELASVDWSFLDADLSFMEELDVDMQAADGRIERYNEQVCGLTIGGSDGTASDDTGDDSFNPSAGTAREQIEANLVELGFTPEEAACITDNVDITGYLETSQDQLIFEAFDACEIPASRLVEIGGG